MISKNGKYYTMCRLKDIYGEYFCQTYLKIPKQLICDNCNLILFKKKNKEFFRSTRNSFFYINKSFESWLGKEQFSKGILGILRRKTCHFCR